MRVKTIYEFTRRQGQQHWAEAGANSTLCGMAMLTENHASTLKAKAKVPCPDCLEARGQLDTQVTTKEELEASRLRAKARLLEDLAQFREACAPIQEELKAAADAGDHSRVTKALEGLARLTVKRLESMQEAN